MTLYRLVTDRPPAKAYAMRAGALGSEIIIRWTPAKNSAALFRRSDARRLARRMRRLRIRTKVEAA